jgi:RHS repeat-associated protein
VGKLYERELLADGQVKHKHFIYAGGQLVAIQVKAEEDGAPLPDETRYLHRDNLGSIDTITDGRGNIVERLSYTPFGARRAGDWRATDPYNPAGLVLASFTNRGFTGHEHVEEMGLIHMNGRVYDPVLGRFLSADPNVQFPHASQSYNRYAYVLNNPLKYTDPSGYFLSGLFKSIGKFFKKFWKPILAITLAIVTYGVMSTWLGGVGVVGAYSCGAPTFTAFQVGMMSGAASGFVSGGILSGSLEGAVSGAIAGGVMGGLNSALANADLGIRMLSRSVASGAIAHVRGGDWKRAIYFSMMVDLGRSGWQYTMKQTDKLYASACAHDGNCRSDEFGYQTDGGRVVERGINQIEWLRVPKLLRNYLGGGMAEEGSGTHLYDPGHPPLSA